MGRGCCCAGSWSSCGSCTKHRREGGSIKSSCVSKSWHLFMDPRSVEDVCFPSDRVIIVCRTINRERASGWSIQVGIVMGTNLNHEVRSPRRLKLYMWREKHASGVSRLRGDVISASEDFSSQSEVLVESTRRRENSEQKLIVVFDS